MSKRDFSQALRELDRALAKHGLGAQADARIRQRIEARRQSKLKLAASRRRLTIVAFATAAIACGVIWLVFAQHPKPSEGHRLGVFWVIEASADLKVDVAADQTVSVRYGSCTFYEPSLGATLRIGNPVVLRKEADALRLVRGSVEVSVAKRAPAQGPALIRVSAGTIEVLGTRFTIVEQGTAGRVSLEEGRIRFVHQDGQAVTLTPGQALTWPPDSSQAVAASPTTAPERTVHPSRKKRVVVSAAEQAELDSILASLERLRSRGQYEEAAHLLEQVLAAPLSAGTRERLSYELGSILTHQIGDRMRACEHWRAHQSRYSPGLYDLEVAQARAHLHCLDEKGQP